VDWAGAPGKLDAGSGIKSGAVPGAGAGAEVSGRDVLLGDLDLDTECDRDTEREEECDLVLDLLDLDPDLDLLGCLELETELRMLPRPLNRRGSGDKSPLTRMILSRSCLSAPSTVGRYSSTRPL